MGLTMGQRQAVMKANATRYRRADKASKGLMLDELCATTGWHRNHARKALAQALKPKIVRTRPPPPAPRRRQQRPAGRSNSSNPFPRSTKVPTPVTGGDIDQPTRGCRHASGAPPVSAVPLRLVKPAGESVRPAIPPGACGGEKSPRDDELAPERAEAPGRCRGLYGSPQFREARHVMPAYRRTRSPVP